MAATYHVPHRVLLESELLGKVQENVLDLLRRHGYLAVRRPGGEWFARAREVSEGVARAYARAAAHVRLDGGAVVRVVASREACFIAGCGGRGQHSSVGRLIGQRVSLMGKVGYEWVPRRLMGGAYRIAPAARGVGQEPDGLRRRGVVRWPVRRGHSDGRSWRHVSSSIFYSLEALPYIRAPPLTHRAALMKLSGRPTRSTHTQLGRARRKVDSHWGV